MNTHKAQVKRATRGLQLGTVALLGAAGAAIGLPLSGMFGPPEPKKVVVVDDSQGKEAPKAPPIMTSGEAAEVLKTLISWKPAPAEPETPAPDAAATPPPPPPPAPTEWAYVGSVLMGSNRQAIVRVNTEQHMLKPGQQHGDTTLVDIDPRFITVETAGQRKQIDLLARANVFPTEPPKRGGQVTRGPSVGAGNVTAMNQNGMVKPPVPGSFDQARMQAEEMAKKRGMMPPGRQGVQDAELLRQQEAELKEKLATDPSQMRDHFERAVKAMNDPGMSLEQRTQMLHELGIPVGASPEVAMERFRNAGLNPDEHQGLIEAVKANARGQR